MIYEEEVTSNTTIWMPPGIWKLARAPCFMLHKIFGWWLLQAEFSGVQLICSGYKAKHQERLDTTPEPAAS